MNIIHLTSNGEFAKPLVASQLFDQAELMAIKYNVIVEVWIVEPFRTLLSKKKQSVKAELSKRCPHISIRFLYAVGRWNNFGVLEMAKHYRKKFAHSGVIYHCRGENAVYWAKLFKHKFFNSDKILFDVRGYWPAELIYNFNHGEDMPLDDKEKDLYTKACHRLSDAIESSDAVCTVSPKLKLILKENHHLKKPCHIVPCCCNPDFEIKRIGFRRKWGVAENKKIFVYSGTTAPYQHLQDITIPFMMELLKINEQVHLLFLTPEPELLKSLLPEGVCNSDRITIDSVLQNEAMSAINACDYALLLRKVNLVNSVAQPVKVGEYLSAGVPLFFQKGIGGIPDSIEQENAGVMLDLDINDNESLRSNLKTVAAALKSGKLSREKTRNFGVRNFTWQNNIEKHFNAYQALLK
ncbi:hypothetical protein [Fulvivirga sp.]|uniref:hypothetical protein n=1 Tax=Fulvivirga sp. TaxID=1931237 RepID=UPI0032EE9C72